VAAIKLTLAYLGTEFCGWQQQPRRDRLSCQERLESALGTICGRPVRVKAAGRTDAGVHSLGQVAVIDAPVKRSPAEILKGVNALLPPAIRVVRVQRVADEFHPRYQAVSKTYRYLIQNQPVASPFWNACAWFFPDRLDLAVMKRAAGRLEGRHDFSAFQDSGRRVADPVRTLYRCRVARAADPFFGGRRLISIEMTADGFLYKMARNIVGTLVEIGRGKLDPEAVREILVSGDRRRAGPTAPARGLCLVRVDYAKPGAGTDRP